MTARPAFVLSSLCAVALLACTGRPGPQLTPFAPGSGFPPAVLNAINTMSLIATNAHRDPQNPAQVTETRVSFDLRCSAREAALSNQVDAKRDAQEKTETLVGIITGALTTVGGIVAAAQDIDTEALMMGEDPGNPATGWAIATAVTGAAGGVVAAAIEPGAGEAARVNRQIQQIQTQVNRLSTVANAQPNPSQWTTAQDTEWKAAYDQLVTLCP